MKETLVAKEIPVILGTVQRLPSERDDSYDEPNALPGELHAAGVKIAFATLVPQLARWGFELVDCQMTTEHLARFGATEWSRDAFLDALRSDAFRHAFTSDAFRDALGIEADLQYPGAKTKYRSRERFLIEKLTGAQDTPR